jgi:SAM-dependent methyltransferase
LDQKSQIQTIDSFAAETAPAMRASPRPRCIVCGSPGGRLYHDLRDSVFTANGNWSISRCANDSCGLLWLDPMPLAEDLGMAYESYYTHGEPRRSPVHRFLRLTYRGLTDTVLFVTGIPQERRRSELMYLGTSQPGSLLDVGCGSGDFMAKMRGRGWSVAGVDFDPAAAEAARTLYGLDVRVGTLDALGDPTCAFDVVTASHVIEHIPDPVEFLAKCRKYLRSGGRVVLKTPNAWSYGARRYGAAWRGLEPPRHLQIFTVPSLVACARKAGFSVSACFTSSAGADGILVASRFIARKKSFRVNELSAFEKLESRLLRPWMSLQARIAWLKSRVSGEEICAILTNDA